jgi:uncharacterized MAPEG superfamily protein
MSMPMALLAWAAFLGLLHALSTGAATLVEHGAEYNLSPRDEQRPLPPGKARNARAFANFAQTFPLFAAAVLVSHAVGRDHGAASWGAQFYFWARLVYVPLYLTGSRYRTAAFGVSVFGLLLVFWSIA